MNNKALILTACCALTALGLLRWATAQQPAGHWPLDEGGGTNTVDVSTNANHGILTGQPVPAWTSGVSSNALTFDGVQNELVIPDAPSLSPTNAISLTAWVKTSTNLTADILGKWSTNELAGSYILGLTNGQVRLELMLDGEPVCLVGSNPGLPTTGWNHVAGTYDGQLMLVYLNGQPVGYREIAGNIGAITNEPLRVGLLTGQVDDVRLYDQAVGPSVLQDLAAQTFDSSGSISRRIRSTASKANSSGRQDVSGDGSVGPTLTALTMLSSSDLTNGLRAWWKFDETSGSTAADSSGNTNTATLYNGASRVSGIDSNAVACDGVNDYLRAVNRSSLNNCTAWTFATWINPVRTQSTFSERILFKQDQIYWALPAGSPRSMEVSAGPNTDPVSCGIDLPTNTWTHLAVTYTNSQVKFYVNGTNVSSVARTFNMGSANYDLYISSSTYSLAGRLDDLRYYGRALGADEVQALYAFDSDGDGLSNIDEIKIYGTDRYNPDTDGDGMPDGWEVTQPLWGPTGIVGAYYDNHDLTNLKLTRLDPTINFDWGDGGSPHPSIDDDYFSIRWVGKIKPRYTQTYTFKTVSDDGVDLYVDNQRIINSWNASGSMTLTGSVALVAGQLYDIELWYKEYAGRAKVQLYWSSPSQPQEIVPASCLYNTCSSALVANAADDQDQDGYNNLQEYTLGTLPADPNTHPDTNAIPPYLLAWWPLDEGQGSTLLDASGNGRTGTLTNSPAWTTGLLSNAVEFATNKWASALAHAGLNEATNTLTVAGWLRPSAVPTGTGTAFFSKGTGTNNGWAFSLTNGLNVAFQMGASNRLCSTTSLSTGLWTHVAAVVTSNSATLYFNGIAVTNALWTGSRGANTNAVQWGRFAGATDDLRIYWKPLSAAEVLNVAAAGDSDGDGMPNSWELLHGLNPNLPDADQDADLDGATNLQEYQQSTDPQDYYNGSAPQLQIVSGNNQAGFTNTFCSQPLVVSVNATNGVAQTNAPVRLVVVGSGLLAPDTSGNGLTNALNLRSDNTGRVSAWFRLPSTWATTNQVQALAISGTSTSTVLFTAQTATLPDLVGWWRLDEGGGTNVYDSSGFRNHGYTVANPAWIAGAYSNALQFSGTATDDHVRVPVSSSLDASNALTVAAWVWPTSMPVQEMAVVSYRAREYDNGWRIFYYPNRITFQWAPTGQTYRWLGANGNFPSNTWTHIAATYQAGRAELFVNGQRVAVDNNAGTNLVLSLASYPLRIGRCDNGNSYRFPGKVDDVRVYSRALATNEVAALFSTVGDGIADWWKLQNGLSTTDPNIASADPDNDGLTNLQEYQLGTNPNNADTDWDGLPDAVDASPAVADSSPPSFLVISPVNGQVLNP